MSKSSKHLKSFEVTGFSLKNVDSELTLHIEILKKLEYQTISEIKISPNKKVKVVFVRGPEGIMLELVQELV